MNIRQIESLTYEEAEKKGEKITIKGHDCFWVNLGVSFGYSILVFKNKRQIYYANDYELLHTGFVKENGVDALKQYYIQKMSQILFTDEELLKEVTSYDEYTRKDYFLRNYWIMRYDYLSCCFFEKEEEKFREGKKTHPYFVPMCMCYVKNETIQNKSAEYDSIMKNSYRNLMKYPEHFRTIIATELDNHEACITCSADETLDALKISFDKLTPEQQKIVQEELKKQMDRFN